MATQPTLNGTGNWTNGSGNPSAPTYAVGDCLIGFFWIEAISTGTVTAVTDNLGVAWTMLGNGQSGSTASDAYSAIFYRRNCPAGITNANLSGVGIAGGQTWAIITSWTGVQSVAQGANQAGSGPGTTQTLLNTATDSVMVGGVGIMHNNTISITLGTDISTNTTSFHTDLAQQQTWDSGSGGEYRIIWNWGSSDKYSSSAVELTAVPDMPTRLQDEDNTTDKEDDLFEWLAQDMQQSPLSGDLLNIEVHTQENSMAEMPELYDIDDIKGNEILQQDFNLWTDQPLPSDDQASEIERVTYPEDPAAWEEGEREGTDYLPEGVENIPQPFSQDNQGVHTQVDDNAPEIYEADYYDPAPPEGAKGPLTIDAVVFWGTTSYRKGATPYEVLVEIDWNGGTGRYAGHDLGVLGDSTSDALGYDGRLLSVDAINLEVDDTHDSASFTLQNTTFGSSATIESLWSDAHPPEGAVVRIYYWFSPDTVSQRMLLFQGVIHEIPSVTEREVQIHALGTEAGLTSALGKEINTTDFPSAPKGSVGQMQPIVFGTVERMEGLPVTTIARTTTTAPVLSSDTLISVGDTSQFPISGSAMINGVEIVTYGGISSGQLTGCTRGTSGTTAADYGQGVDVVYYGELDVMFAGHEGSISAAYAVVGQRAVLLSASDYTVSGTVSGPLIAQFSTGWPLIPIPSGTLGVQQLQMDAPTSSDSSLNGVFACGNAQTWDDLNAASVSTTYPILDIQRTSSITPNGDIVRAFVVVEFQDNAFPLTSPDAVNVSVNGGPSLGQLAAGQNLGTALRDLVGLGLVRVNDSTHTHTVTATATATINLRKDVDASVVLAVTSDTFNAWATSGPTPLSNTIDGNDGTNALSSTRNTSGWADGMSLGKVSVTGFGSYGSQSGKTPTRIRAHCRYGQPAGGPPFYTDDAYLNLLVNGVLKAQIRMEGSEASYGVEFVSDWYVTALWSDVSLATVQAQHIRSVDGSGNYVLWGQNITEMWLEVEYIVNSTNVNATAQASVYSNGMAFEITTQVAGLWSYFANATIRCTYSGSHATVVKIARCYFLVEISSFKLQPAERILADVQGLVPSGNPGEILRSILTHSFLLALPGVPYGTGELATAIDLLNGVVIQRFVQRQAISGKDLISKVCAEGRLRRWWEGGKLMVAYKPAIAAMPAPAFIWGNNEASPQLVGRQRSSLDQVVTSLVVLYKRDDLYQVEASSYTATLSGPLSTKKAQKTYETIRDDIAAQSVAGMEVERASRPTYSATFEMPLVGFDNRRGSTQGILIGRLSYQKLEVLRLQIKDSKITITVTVWDTV